MPDHPSYVWWEDGDEPELEAVVYALLEEVTAEEGIDFLDHLVTQEVMTYTIKDEIHEILAETMCELAADASLSYVLNEVLDMDLGGLNALATKPPGAGAAPPSIDGAPPGPTDGSGTVPSEFCNGTLVLPSEQEEGVRPGPVVADTIGDGGLPSCGEAEPEPEATPLAEYLDSSAIRSTARSVLSGRDELFATQEKTFSLNETPLGDDLAKAEALSEAEGEYYRDHMVEADIAQQTHDRSFWGAFLAAAGNAWHEPMHRLRARGRQRLRFVYLYEGDSPLDNPEGASEGRSARSLGPNALRQHHVYPLSEEQKAEAEERHAASNQITQSDAQGIDFFVSQSWAEQDDDSLAIRWEALCAVSDAFQEQHGRPPKFWIESLCVHASNRAQDIHDHVTVLPVVLAFCKTMLALHTPAYLGWSAPRTDGSLWAMADLYIAAMLAPREKPNYRVIWFSLIKGSAVPPLFKLVRGHSQSTDGRLTDGGLSCASLREHDHLLTNLSNCPGGLPAVQRKLADMWPLLFHREHRQWLALCKAAENPHPQGVAEVARLLKAGACSDFPVSAAKALGDAQNTFASSTWLDERRRWQQKQQQPLAVAIIEYLRRAVTPDLSVVEPLSRKAIDLLLQHGADRLTVLHHPDLGAVCRGFGVATELLSEILKPEFPRLDLLRSHELDVGAAQVIAEIFQVNDGLESVCGISPGQMEVNLAGQNLTDASMRLLSTEKRVVQSLDLSSNPSISDDGIRLLGRMDHLRELSMQACSGWGGELRDIAAACPNLTALDVSRTRAQGSLENILAGCKRIEVLNLRLTRVKGSLQFVAACGNLRSLDLGFTEVEGNLGALFELGMLEYVDLTSSHVEGNLEMLEHCSHLVTLELSDNKRIYGDIEALAGCSHLKVLVLGDTSVAGRLEGLNRCRAIEVLSLFRTRVQGTFEYIGRCSSIVKVDLFDCQGLSGPLNGFASCPKLELLNLSRTAVSGSLLPLEQCPSLRLLNLDHCAGIDHTTVAFLKPCTKLQNINLHGCLGDSVNAPSSQSLASDAGTFAQQTLLEVAPMKYIEVFGGCRNIVRINMQSCEHITGTLEPFAACRKLRSLNFNKTGVFGSLAPLGSCKGLGELCLGFTDVDGPLDALSKCKSLTMLVLCFTKVHGHVDPLAACRMLSQIDLRKTRVIGNIQCLAKCHQIKKLNLSYTEIRGDLNCLRTCNDLASLNVTWATGITGVDDFIGFQKTSSTTTGRSTCRVRTSDGQDAAEVVTSPTGATKPRTFPSSKGASPVKSRRWRNPGNTWSEPFMSATSMPKTQMFQDRVE